MTLPEFPTKHAFGCDVYTSATDACDCGYDREVADALRARLKAAMEYAEHKVDQVGDDPSCIAYRGKGGCDCGLDELRATLTREGLL